MDLWVCRDQRNGIGHHEQQDEKPSQALHELLSFDKLVIYELYNRKLTEEVNENILLYDQFCKVLIIENQ